MYRLKVLEKMAKLCSILGEESNPEVLTYDEFANMVRPGAQWEDITHTEEEECSKNFPSGVILVIDQETKELTLRLIAGERT
jgi:hypothetical protein